MTQRITIGILIPSSTITPMGKSFESGFKNGLQKLREAGNWEVDLVSEFIGAGSKEKLETAINKLVGYDGADIITGIVSNRSYLEVANRVEKAQKPFLINNLGEHLPNLNLFNSNMFLNSSHLWQQVWSLGYWGVKTFGTTGMFVSGLYDAGYSFSSMLQAGMLAASADSKMPFSIAPVAQPGDLADVKQVFRHIEQFKPDFVMATFCGEEASIFLKEYTTRGLHKKQPLLGLPFLLQPFGPAEEMEVYTTFSTNSPIEVDRLETLEAVTANPFHQLGFETGELISTAVLSQNFSNLNDALTEVTVHSARGPLAVNVNDISNTTHVQLVRNIFDGNPVSMKHFLVKELPTVTTGDAEIQKLLKGVSSGWFNPYLGV